MSPLRLLLVVHGYPPTFKAGAELRAQRTARGLVARGADVRVLCVESTRAKGHATGEEDREEDGAQVRRLYLDLDAVPDPFKWSYDNPRIGAATARIIEEWKPSILHLYSGYLTSSSVIRAATAQNVPTVVSLTDYWWLCHRTTLVRSNGTRCDGPTPDRCAGCYREGRRRHRVASKLWPAGAQMVWRLTDTLQGAASLTNRQQDRADTLKDALHDVSAMIAPSQHLADRYIENGVDGTKIHVWRQGVDARPLPSVPSPDLRVGYLGQVKRHKGVHTLLDAWALLRGNRGRQLVLYGSADGEPAYGLQIERMLEQLPGAVWNGHFEASELWRVLANLDVLVIPSRWAENSPNVILEAQAAGVPVIGTRLGGIPELVEHNRNGLLFTVDDAKDLASQLQRTLDEPELLPLLRAEALSVRTVDEEVDQICELYTRLTGEPIQDSRHLSALHGR